MEDKVVEKLEGKIVQLEAEIHTLKEKLKWLGNVNMAQRAGIDVRDADRIFLWEMIRRLKRDYDELKERGRKGGD